MRFIFLFMSFFLYLSLLKSANIIQNNIQEISNIDESFLNNFFKQKALRKIKKKENIINEADQYINFLSRNKENQNNAIIADILTKENKIFNQQNDFEPIEKSQENNELNEEDLVKEYFREVILNNEENQKTKKIDKGLLVVIMSSVVAIWGKLFLLDRSTEKHAENLAEMEEWVKKKEMYMEDLEKYISEMKEKIQILNQQHEEVNKQSEEIVKVYEKLVS